MKTNEIFKKYINYLMETGDFDHLPLKDVRLIAAGMTMSYEEGYRKGKHSMHTTSEAIINEIEKNMMRINRELCQM